ncbi:MAG: hypothetical protein Fur0021_37290 [Candidatus Promineifilaceae bacterium]
MAEDAFVGEEVEAEKLLVVGGGFVGVEGDRLGICQFGDSHYLGQKGGGEAVQEELAEEAVGVVAGVGELGGGHAGGGKNG